MVLQFYRSCLLALSSDLEEGGCICVMSSLLSTWWPSWTEFKTCPGWFLHTGPASDPQEPLCPLTYECHQASLWALSSLGINQTWVFYAHNCRGQISKFLPGYFEAFLIRHAVGINIATTLPQRRAGTRISLQSILFIISFYFFNFLTPIG